MNWAQLLESSAFLKSFPVENWNTAGGPAAPLSLLSSFQWFLVSQKDTPASFGKVN